jgi:lysophospholipase L1-like esterase
MTDQQLPHSDDSQMSRFERSGVNLFSGLDAIKATAVVAVVLVLFAGDAVRNAADELDPGVGRDIVSAVGSPTAWIADRLPFEDWGDDLTGWLSPDEELGGGGFDATATPAEIPPAESESSGEPQPLDKLLVTGDSLSTPLDLELARSLAEDDVEVVRDPHLATGISNSALADWGELSTAQVRREAPDAVVVFIGANEGYPLPAPGGGDVSCCGAEWRQIFAGRVVQMMDTYVQDGDATVYWLTIPTARDPDRAEIADTVNQAYLQAADSFPDDVRTVDMVEPFTPGDRYRDSIEIDGDETIVRESDGIHLNDAGSAYAAEIVLAAIDEDFTR